MNKFISNASLHCDNQVKIVNLEVPCVFIIGDMKVGDQKIFHAGSYHLKQRRFCHKCNISGWELGNIDYKCQKISMNSINFFLHKKN